MRIFNFPVQNRKSENEQSRTGDQGFCQELARGASCWNFFLQTPSIANMTIQQ